MGSLYHFICGEEHWGYRTKFNLRIFKVSIQVTADVKNHANKLIVLWSKRRKLFYKPWIELHQWHLMKVYDKWDFKGR